MWPSQPLTLLLPPKSFFFSCRGVVCLVVSRSGPPAVTAALDSAGAMRTLAFESAKRFNADISGWDVSKVTTFDNGTHGRIFDVGGTSNLGEDVKEGTSVCLLCSGRTFDACSHKFLYVLPQPRSLTTHGALAFRNCLSFNADISDWDVSAVNVFQNST